ncbi:phage portal protein [Ignavigranum ruoffiae]|uniref:Phage portal protein, SPP1 Gp6-like n=1 Tax=Ignavigranum ruoffiae TaxID=89093 RepID=A0A1H9BUN4_9LACT|nr:phage portal protein [Ignavigranum ruoffiae]SEP92441.1 Phage portal protein, SPP1 Gp6-like [Ignavigranum ruoffiae]
MDLMGKEYLEKKLNNHKHRVETRYKYYDMKHKQWNKSFTMPPQIQMMFKSTIGWTTKAVDTLADRLIFREFANDLFDLNEIFDLNNPDTFFDSAILSALIASCCFVYISSDKDGYPRLQVIEANNATGIIDPITGLLKEGYAVLSRTKEGNPETEAYFQTGLTTIYNKSNNTVTKYKNNAPAPLLVPIINRPDAVRPFGRSRISRSAMYWQNYAARVLERSDVTAEFYSFPQKYVVGTSQDSEKLDTWKATVSSMLEFTQDEDGGHPILGQFTTSSMTPFIEQLRMAAAGFAGETGLTLDDLGFVTDNPSSAEAIKASHETLRVTARKAQRNFGSGFLNVGFLATCIRDNFSYKRNQFYKTIPKWEPVFEPDAATISAIGDGVIKINQSIPGYFGNDNLRDLTGMEGDSDGYIPGFAEDTANGVLPKNQIGQPNQET